MRLGCALLVLVFLVAAPVAATTGATQANDSTAPEPALVVALDTDGSARVTLVTTFDLATDSERAAFEALRANQTAREQRTARFAGRMQAIAIRAEDTAEREMTVRDPTMAFSTANATGILTLSVTWDGLAARGGDRIVLREPFASGFDIDRPFRVVAPDGYELSTATPPPTTRQQSGVTWSAATRFEGFEAEFVTTDDGPTAGASGGTSGAGTPGLGVGVTVAAIVIATALPVIRRRRTDG